MKSSNLASKIEKCLFLLNKPSSNLSLSLTIKQAKLKHYNKLVADLCDV